jgi:threonine/homoserine/homoserine lactone efflux protein
MMFPMSLSISGETLLAFTLAMVLLAASPGPGFLMVVARALTGGFVAGLAAIAGLVAGDIVFLVAAILFYGALLPTFIDVAALTAPDVVALTVVVTLVLFLVLGVYAFLAARAGRMVKSQGALRWINRATGGLLVGAGIAVATR